MKGVPRWWLLGNGVRGGHFVSGTWWQYKSSNSWKNPEFIIWKKKQHHKDKFNDLNKPGTASGKRGFQSNTVWLAIMGEYSTMGWCIVAWCEAQDSAGFSRRCSYRVPKICSVYALSTKGLQFFSKWEFLINMAEWIFPVALTVNEWCVWKCTDWRKRNPEIRRHAEINDGGDIRNLEKWGNQAWLWRKNRTEANKRTNMQSINQTSKQTNRMSNYLRRSHTRGFLIVLIKREIKPGWLHAQT